MSRFHLRDLPHMDALNAEFPLVEMYGPRCIGAEVGPGWVGLLRPCLEAMSRLGCKVGQIKQKFGGLVIYWDPPEVTARGDFNLMDVRVAIAEAERLSFATCDECGASIDPPRQPSHQTLCDSCGYVPYSR